MLKKLSDDVVIPGWDLAYFQTGEWQVISERLDDYDQSMVQYNPPRSHLFAALVACPCERVRVVILGQDPYPNRMHCTGIAFSCPGRVKPIPHSLENIFKEYEADLHYPTPKNGDLTPWVKQGVLLWNVYPSCLMGKPGSHHWDEWTYLTKEIVEKLDAKGNVVFCALGSVARSFTGNLTNPNSRLVTTSHPSPLGFNKGFKGSRIFSTINFYLCSLDQPTIEWRLE